MNLNGIQVEGLRIADWFAEFFDKKIKTTVDKVHIDDDVYNGKQKMKAGNLDFMTKTDIISCVKMLKVKNCEGYDRIPQRVLIDGIDLLINPLTKLFSMIYVKNYL